MNDDIDWLEGDEIEHENRFVAKVTLTVIAVTIIGFALILYVCNPTRG